MAKRPTPPADFGPKKPKRQATTTGTTRRWTHRRDATIAVVEVVSAYGLPTEYLVARKLGPGEISISSHRSPAAAFLRARKEL